MMRKRPVIALLAPLQNAYSETFINAHKKRLNGKVNFFFGGWVPNQLEGGGYLSTSRPGMQLLGRVWTKVQNKINPETIISPAEWKHKDLRRAFLQNKVNVVLAEYGPTAAECLPVCRELQIPLIVHFHGFDASQAKTLERYSTAYKEVFDYASFVIGVSRRMLQVLTELGVPKQKLVYNPYGPDEIFFSIQHKEAGKKFFSVGRFVDKKAPCLTLLAFQKVLGDHPDACLVFGGEGPLWNACKDMAQALHLSGKVQFPGRLDPAMIRAHMTDSLVYVQHSVTADDGDSEGAPVAIIEAGAAGLPVVSTFHAGIPDIIKDGETGFLVEERDVDSMARRMSQLAGDFKLARKMGCAARKRIQENFTMGKHIGILNELIEKCL